MCPLLPHQRLATHLCEALQAGHVAAARLLQDGHKALQGVVPRGGGGLERHVPLHHQHSVAGTGAEPAPGRRGLLGGGQGQSAWRAGAARARCTAHPPHTQRTRRHVPTSTPAKSDAAAVVQVFGIPLHAGEARAPKAAAVGGRQAGGSPCPCGDARRQPPGALPPSHSHSLAPAVSFQKWTAAAPPCASAPGPAAPS